MLDVRILPVIVHKYLVIFNLPDLCCLSYEHLYALT